MQYLYHKEKDILDLFLEVFYLLDNSVQALN